MTTINQGYLAVLKSLPPGETLYNPHYQGIDRIPRFSLEDYKEGFNDPYLFKRDLAPAGLIPSFSLAKEVLQSFAQIEHINKLEIIYVRTCTDRPGKTIESAGPQFLGFDVAGEKPFWSIVNDSPPPDDSNYQRFLSQLNHQGLFSSWQTAKDYLETYLRNHPEKLNSGLNLWEIYSVQQEISGHTM